LGIDYVRRRTGGGAVYHDRDGELTYSIAVDEDDPLVSKTSKKHMKRFAQVSCMV
jgi:lipoate-protein ligase A